MRKSVTILLIVLGVLGLTLQRSSAQGGPPPTPPDDDGPVYTNQPPSQPPPMWYTNHYSDSSNDFHPPGFTNNFNNLSNSFAWGTNFWWTNTLHYATNHQEGTHFTNSRPRVLAPGQNSPSTLPPNVQTVIKQFQQQRGQLIKQLQNSSDSQRQQILQSLEGLRENMQEQLGNWKQNMVDQARDMQFNNKFLPKDKAGSDNTPSPSGGQSSGGHYRP